MSAKYTEDESGMIVNLKAERATAKGAARSGNPAKRASALDTIRQADELLASLRLIAERRGEET